MRSIYLSLSLFIIVCMHISATYAQQQRFDPKYFLIAHRGGVVDSTYTENGLPALLAAKQRGYKMVEVDLRMTKDSVLIVQHDANFKKYYGVNRAVTDMTWQDISSLKSDKDGCSVSRFEKV